MPEQQVVKAIEAMVNLGKGMGGSMYVEDERFRLEIAPITHSKKKKTLTVVEVYDYTYPQVGPGWTYAPQHWIDRADEEGFGHLMAKVPYAPLICRSRGKFLCMAAGPHALVIFLALESNVVGMPLELYQEITSNDFDGPNQDRVRASEELRVFKIPERLAEKYSSKKDRSIKIVAAFVSKRWAWVINDFSSLVLMKVFSRDSWWKELDIRPVTKDWNILFDSFKGGPDWTLENGSAKERLFAWRQDVLRDYRKSHRQATLFKRTKLSTNVRITNPSASYITLFRPIISEILNNKHGCFAGIGKYSANDLLHTLAIYPGTPAYVICNDPKRFSEFEAGIDAYLAEFSTSSYIKRASSIPNTDNPFSFNEHLNTEFLSKWVLVYKRSKAVLPVDLYNKYISQGLLDENHVIGEPYSFDQNALLENTSRKRVFLPVWKCIGPADFCAYTVIKAKTPEGWGNDIQRIPMEKDLKKFSYSTTIGVPQFHVHVLNRQNYAHIEPGKLINGRPKRILTGKAGRPRKSPTKAAIRKLSDVQRGRLPD